MRIDMSTLTPGRTVYGEHVWQDNEALDTLGYTLAEPLIMRTEAVWVEGVLYLRITTHGLVYSRCDLCGEPCTAEAACVLDEELDTSGPYFDPETQSFDLTTLENEALVMSAPRKALCKPDCKGVCPVCGINRNVATCNCTQASNIGENNPFGVLQELFSTGGANNGSTKM